jgi:peptidoglycan/LPS O-acetylase OafA/YrhL
VLAFAALWPVLAVMASAGGQPLLSTLLIADYAPYFAGGMLLYLLHRDGNDLVTWALLGMQSLFALHFALGYYPGALSRATGWAVSPALVALISFACFGLVALVTLTRLNRSAAGWLTTLGALTYPIYLVHEKIGFFAIHVTRAHVSPWLALAAGLAASLAVAAALHRFVERPFGGRLRAAVLRSLTSAGRSERAPRPAGPAAPLPVQAQGHPAPASVAAEPGAAGAWVQRLPSPATARE